MPLQDFLNNSGSGFGDISGNNGKEKTGLSAFLEREAGQQGGGFDTQTFDTKKEKVEAPKEEKKTSKVMDSFRWVGKQLMKPTGVAAKELRATGEIIGSLAAIASPKVSAGTGFKSAAKAFLEGQKGAWGVLSGADETNVLKEMERAGMEPDKFDKTMAIGADFILDPLNFVPVAKVAKVVGKATAPVTKAIAPTVKAVTESKKAKAIKSLFTNATDNKEFDNTVQKFRDLFAYREANLIDDAVKLQKDIKTLGKGADAAIVEGLENPDSLKTASEGVKKTVNTLDKVYKTLLTESKKVGLKVGEIEHYAPHIRTKESFMNNMKSQFGLGAKEFGKGSIEKGRKMKGTLKELEKKGIEIFEKNPAIQYAKKGQTYAKAITSAEFANEVKKFAIKDGVDVTNSLLKGMKFAPEQAKVIDNFYQGVKPEELNAIFKTFDKVQNWWKAQALVSPSYHTRNSAGNLWNNYLAGVNPAMYGKAGMIQSGKMKAPELVEEMKKLGVINEGWYAKDIGEEVVNRVKGTGNWKTKINPLSQENAAFKLNKKAGSAVENNARMAHYLSKREAGMTAEEAAQSVKKYLFDYGDLTSFEKNVMKRVFPFYTWTRKNLPVQLEALFTQPNKMVLPHKVIRDLEAGTEAPNEKYMGHYIKNNIPVRVRINDDGNSEYLLMGNWLPYASAIDLLSNPLESIVGMTTPFVKTPYEIASNMSTFFKDTLGEPSKIERRYKQQGEFLGMSMRKKNIQLLRNIRILNDMNKIIDKQDPTAVKNSWNVKLLNVLFGKSATYDVGKSKFFYDMDTDDRVNEYKGAIKDAQRRGFGDKANELRNELQEFKQMRYGDE